MPWGMYSAKVESYLIEHQGELLDRGISVDTLSPVHPTFLYESIWCLLGFVLLYYIMKKHYKFAGQLILCYGVVYGAERAVVEGFRTDSLYLGDTNIRISQVLSAVIAVLCLTILILKFRELKKNPVEYNPVEALPADRDYEVVDKIQEHKDERKQRKEVAKLRQKRIKDEEESMRRGNDNGRNN